MYGTVLIHNVERTRATTVFPAGALSEYVLEVLFTITTCMYACDKPFVPAGTLLLTTVHEFSHHNGLCLDDRRY